MQSLGVRRLAMSDDEMEVVSRCCCLHAGGEGLTGGGWCWVG